MTRIQERKLAAERMISGAGQRSLRDSSWVMIGVRVENTTQNGQSSTKTEQAEPQSIFSLGKPVSTNQNRKTS